MPKEYCRSCGMPMPTSAYLHKCRDDNTPGDFSSYCPDCGRKIQLGSFCDCHLLKEKPEPDFCGICGRPLFGKLMQQMHKCNPEEVDDNILGYCPGCGCRKTGTICYVCLNKVPGS